MASINSRRGKLVFDFRYKGLRCREQTNLTDNKVNRRRTELILKRIESEILLDQFDYAKYFSTSKMLVKFKQIEKAQAVYRSDDNPVMTFSEFAELWLSEKKVEWRESNYKTVQGVLNTHLLSVFGERKLNDITKADILNFRSGLAKVPGRKNGTLSQSRINHIMTPIRVIMNEAAERFEFTSPWRNIKALKVPRTDIEPFSLGDVRKVLDDIHPNYRCYFLVRFFTAMRSGEIDGLEWKNVDFERRQLLITQALVRDKLVPTKTDGSYRSIDMSQPVYDALIVHRRAVGLRSKFVFSTRKGTHVQNRYITRKVWYPCLDRCFLSRRTPYQTRHTAATLWLAAGESPEWIANQMGHSSTTMLFKVYSRFIPNLTRQDGSAFERLINETFDHPEQKKEI